MTSKRERAVEPLLTKADIRAAEKELDELLRQRHELDVEIRTTYQRLKAARLFLPEPRLVASRKRKEKR